MLAPRQFVLALKQSYNYQLAITSLTRANDRHKQSKFYCPNFTFHWPQAIRHSLWLYPKMFYNLSLKVGRHQACWPALSCSLVVDLFPVSMWTCFDLLCDRETPTNKNGGIGLNQRRSGCSDCNNLRGLSCEPAGNILQNLIL